MASSWSEFAEAAPDLAASLRAAIYQYGPGLGYLATLRADGSPRLHPVSPLIVLGGLYCCVVNTPKRRDLDRDPRFALHTFPPEDSDDEAGVRGIARPVTDPGVVRRVAMQGRADSRIDWWLYELRIESAFFVRRSEVPAVRTWRDPRGREPAGRRAGMTLLQAV